MRIFKAPGKKKAPPKVIQNLGGNGKNFLSNILGTIVNAVKLPLRLISSAIAGKGRKLKSGNLTGGRRLRRRKDGRRKPGKKKSWWVKADHRRAHDRGGNRVNTHKRWK